MKTHYKVIIFIFLIIAVNLIFTGILKHSIIIIRNKHNKLETVYKANHERHSALYREHFELNRRDRIINYAQNNLQMKLLKPDMMASGNIIKEINEEVVKRNQIIYSILDFTTPNLAILRSKNE